MLRKITLLIAMAFLFQFSAFGKSFDQSLNQKVQLGDAYFEAFDLVLEKTEAYNLARQNWVDWATHRIVDEEVFNEGFDVEDHEENLEVAITEAADELAKAEKLFKPTRQAFVTTLLLGPSKGRAPAAKEAKTTLDDKEILAGYRGLLRKQDILKTK